MTDAIVNVPTDHDGSDFPITAGPGEVMVWRKGRFIALRVDYGDAERGGIGRATTWFGRAEALKIAGALIAFAGEDGIAKSLGESEQ